MPARCGSRTRYVSKAAFADELAKREVVEKKQDEDIDLLFQTQVRLVTSVESLQQEVRGGRKDIRALDAGRPLPPLKPDKKEEP